MDEQACPIGTTTPEAFLMVRRDGTESEVGSLWIKKHCTRVFCNLIFKFMKVLTLGWKWLIGAAGVSFLLATTALAGTNEPHVAQKIAASKPQEARVILVDVTGSRIPQRVVLYGQQVTSGSPLYVVQGQELLNTGATSVAGLLSLDPSVRVVHP
ncbi:MAG: hypothetical protein ACREIF_12260 [Chthoniobacterales bacterium]